MTTEFCKAALAAFQESLTTFVVPVILPFSWNICKNKSDH